ncbi:ABC transporter substrate-binding protein [Paenibacillus oceani]|uniref:ABC transporter substrate-binding protein n=1 Tax=Paenibacillus oceani TaxID=2772510 RepID=UPI001CC227BC|nr:extracellular solute-binding protein [Paenibacillus oceani]
MKRKALLAAMASMMVLASACGQSTEEAPKNGTGSAGSDQMQGEIVMWHSFTQGARNDFMKEAVDAFMAKHPGVKIKIETFAWPEFYTKWTTGLMAGQVPDVSTALPNHVVEMLDADALVPLNDVIDKIGRSRFYEAPLKEGTVEGKNYSIPLYSHAQVMWYRKDLLKQANLEVPKT